MQSTIAETFDFKQVSVTFDFTSDAEESDEEKEFGEEDLAYYNITFLPTKFIFFTTGKHDFFYNAMLPTIFYDSLLLPPEL